MYIGVNGRSTTGGILAMWRRRTAPANETVMLFGILELASDLLPVQILQLIEPNLL